MSLGCCQLANRKPRGIIVLAAQSYEIGKSYRQSWQQKQGETLFGELNVCHANGSFRKCLTDIAKTSLLVIDVTIPRADSARGTTCSNFSMIASAPGRRC
jgi:hypothetical protein